MYVKMHRHLLKDDTDMQVCHKFSHEELMHLFPDSSEKRYARLRDYFVDHGENFRYGDRTTNVVCFFITKTLKMPQSILFCRVFTGESIMTS